MFLSKALNIALWAVPTVLAQCSREDLEYSTWQYLDAQQTGQIQRMEMLDYNLTYTENFNETDLLFGIISQPQVIAHNRSIFDSTGCAAFTEIVVTTADHPYVIGTQMRFDNGRIKHIDSLISDADDWLFNATNTLYWTKKENWDIIPEEDRDSRETIKAAADAYLDVFHDKTVIVPWGTPCDRLEGGAYTGRGAANDSCNVGVPSNVTLANRRYVVDEEMGTVDVFLNFGGDAGAPDSHEFRIQEGKLRYVHTITVTNGVALPAAVKWAKRAAKIPKVYEVPKVPRWSRLRSGRSLDT